MNLVRSVFRSASVLAGLALLAFCAVVLCSCSEEPVKPRLRILCAPDAFDAETVARFEQEKGCIVEIVPRTDDMDVFHRIMDGSDCDLAVAPADLAEEFARHGRLLALNLADLPVVTRNIDTRFLDASPDPGMSCSVPWRADFLGIAYSPERVPKFQFSWTTFSRPDLAGMTAVSDDMRDTRGADLVLLRYDPNTEKEKENARAAGVARVWRDNKARFLSPDKAVDALAEGRIAAAMLSNADALRAAQRNPEIVFCHPEEGSLLRIDSLIIPANALQKELALAFVNHLYRPEIAAAAMASRLHLEPNGPALDALPANLRDSAAFHVPDSVLEGARLRRSLPRKANNMFRLYWIALQGESAESAGN